MNTVGYYSYKISRSGRRAAVWAALICLVLSAASCRTIKTVEVPVPIHDTTYVKSVVKDSVFVEHTTHEYIKGDTVFVKKTLTKYIDRVKTDTVRIYVEKPIGIVKTEIKTVEKPLNWIQKTLVGCGVLFLLSFVVGVTITIFGLKKK